MFCPECGAPNEDDAIFCGNCGAVLNPEETPVEAASGVSPLEEESRAGEAGVYDTIEDIQESVEEPAAIEPVQAVEPREPARPAPSRAPYAPAATGPTTPTSGMAIASLVLGIGGLTLLPLLGSVLAVILGYMARNEIRRRPDEISGEGLAMAGIVLGWIAIGLAALGLLVGGAFTICGLCGFFGSAPYWQ